MLIMVYMDNQTNGTKKYFDGFDVYRKSYLSKNSLMKWKIDQHGNVDGHAGTAVEADENMALACVMAHYQWGSTPQNNYQQEAKDLIDHLMSACVLKPQYVMKPSDTWGGADLLHPCNWAVSYFRVWNDFTGDRRWLSVIDASIDRIRFFDTRYDTGLMPHWCKIDGSATEKPRPYFADYTYDYDACQTPLRYGLYYLWYGTDRTDQPYRHCDRLAAWIDEKTGGDAAKIRDGYQLDGTTIGSNNSDCFVGTFGVAAMCGAGHQALLNRIYDHLRRRPVTNDGYYNTLIRLVTMLTMTGNMPNFQAGTFRPPP